MPWYKVWRMAWVNGSEDWDIIECEDRQEAEDYAHEWAVQDIDWGVEEGEYDDPDSAD